MPVKPQEEAVQPVQGSSQEGRVWEFGCWLWAGTKSRGCECPAVKLVTDTGALLSQKPLG